MAAKQQRDKIEYEFEDLRRNSDPVSTLTLAQFGIEEDDGAERQEGKKRKESARKDDAEDDADRDDDRDLDDDDEVTLTRKELAREITSARQEAERKARKELRAAKDEAGTEIGKLRKRLDGIERKGKSDEIESEFTPQIDELEKQINEAMEAGETVKVQQLNKQLVELIAERKIAQHKAKEAATAAADTEGDDSKRPTTIPRAQEWLDEQEWFDDPEFGYVRAYLNKLDGVLQKKGYRPTDDDYYEKLEGKLEKQFPGIITRTMRAEEAEDDDEDDDDDRGRATRRREKDRDDDDEDEEREGFDDIESKRDARQRARRRQREAGRRHSPVGDDRGGVDRDKARRRERDGDSVTLTRAQIANMRAFQLDPDNPKHVEEYMLEAKRNRRESRR